MNAPTTTATFSAIAQRFRLPAGDKLQVVRLAGFEPLEQSVEHGVREVPCPLWVRAGLALWEYLNWYRPLQPAQAAHLLRWLRTPVEVVLSLTEQDDMMSNQQWLQRLSELDQPLFVQLQDFRWAIMTDCRNGLDLETGQRLPAEDIVTRGPVGTLNVDLQRLCLATYHEPRVSTDASQTQRGSVFPERGHLRDDAGDDRGRCASVGSGHDGGGAGQ